MALGLKIVNGRWYAWGKVKGRLVRKSTGYTVGVRKAEEQAKRVAAELEYAIRAEAQGWASKCPTVEEYWKKTYRPVHTATKRAPELDDQMMAHALPVLGSLRLDAVKKSDCVALLNRRRAMTRQNPGHTRPVTIAEGTVQRFRGFLQGFFQRAIDDEIIDRNPWTAIERVAYQVRDRVLTIDEQRLLLPRLNPEYQRAVRVMLGTGVRIDEFRGIDPAVDIAWQERRLTIRDHVAADGTLLYRSKGGKTRHVPIPIEVVDDLRQQLEACGRLWTQTDARFREVLTTACQGKTAQPARTSRRGRPVDAIEARPAIARIWPHALRHTFGTRYLQGGGDIYKLAQILGDTVAVVERHYAHLLQADLRAAVDKIDLGLSTSTRRAVIAGRFGR